MMERHTRRIGPPKVLAFIAAIALATALPTRARADDALRSVVAWNQLSVALHLGAFSLSPHESWRSAELSASAPPELQWLGTSPHISFVARDWGVSQVLWGHLTVADQLRLSRSSRMVVTRLRFAGGRLAPFAQIGVGQWRVDTSVIATLPTDVELAGQLGGGFELEIAPSAALVLQGDCTFIFPEGREPQMLSSGHLWGTLLAARAQF
jgi:hypothetical protein